ncbi:hypothetical protein HU200_016904 [Digitaria exilis]|uniref:DUF1618 domain-containing protein n=1 Tax=Digitaria exilis TaxID=1010633 RepID=A0A835F866_9POAL|nr:hypothetical protein HU200_016904 [Digitaria exilis]
MRCGADKVNLVVASLQLHTMASQSKTAKLRFLRHGEWSIQQPKFIIDGEGNKDGEQMLSSWQNHTVISARRGFIYCNIYDEMSSLCYIWLPPIEEVEDRLSCRGSNGDVCVTSDGAVKFVCVDPRCCCGSSGGTHCRHSANAYAVRIWTLQMDAMVWEMDSIIDATVLWALDIYKDLPRVQSAWMDLISSSSLYLHLERRRSWLHSERYIPGLVREDMLKANSILSHDNSDRPFRSLLGLPMNLNDWTLMEIKTSEGCSVCSECTANSQQD